MYSGVVGKHNRYMRLNSTLFQKTAILKKRARRSDVLADELGFALWESALKHGSARSRQQRLGQSLSQLHLARLAYTLSTYRGIWIQPDQTLKDFRVWLQGPAVVWRDIYDITLCIGRN